MPRQPLLRHANRPGIIAGVDTGGTFTDAVILENGTLRIEKVPSVPSDPSRAVVQAVAASISECPRSTVVHGSTVATNAILEEKGARTALVTNAGFEDLIEIGRQDRLHLWDLAPTRPRPLVLRELRFAVRERTAADGQRLSRPSQAELRELVRKLAAARVEAVAIGLLHSYRNPVAEREIARALRSLRLPLSLSAEVACELREFERFSTAVINAYVTPIMTAYLRRLGQRLRGSQLLMMQSSGGAAPLREIARHPVHTVLSGPAGGVAGAWLVARSAGIERLVTLDMGGTSTDVALIDGEPAISHQCRVAGRPLLTSSVDIESVGAGGGSIAWIDRGGALRVGPQSAGADPGPACYGRGEEPTVTDAHLALGRLPAALLGGEFPLEPSRAGAVIRRLARRLGTSPERTAHAILAVADATMTRAIRVVSLHRGHDPRDFALLALGGAGGLHAVRLAAALEMPRVVIPPCPGVLSALGLATAPPRKDLVQSVLWDASAIRLERIRHALERLEKQGRRELEQQLPGAPLEAAWFVDCRYRGQSYELTLPFGRALPETFQRAHKTAYGHTLEHTPIEIVSLRVRLTGPAPSVRLEMPPRRRGPPRPAGRSTPLFGGRGVPVYARETLGVGQRLKGPALVTEMSATTFVEAGSEARVDRWGCLWIE
ncbi:MAG: hydantoinase/oxoprolinase family protein [Planctomycetota bacterium]